MVKPGQIMRRVFDSVLDAGTNTQRLRGATDNVSIHLGDVNRRTDGIDVFDGKPDMPNRPDRHTPDGSRHTPDGDGGKRHGIDRGDGRDDYGHFVGSGNKPWSDKEQIGLDEVSDEIGADVIRDQVRARVDGRDQNRYYDGLYQNADGTYTGVEVKSGSATRDAAQQGFDDSVSRSNPATANLNGEAIQIVQVILKEVP